MREETEEGRRRGIREEEGGGEGWLCERKEESKRAGKRKGKKRKGKEEQDKAKIENEERDNEEEEMEKKEG